MRHPIWKKDDFFKPLDLPRLDMNADAIEFEEGKPVPLTLNFDFSSPDTIIGRVEDLRVEDGELTGEVVYVRGEFVEQDPLEGRVDPATNHLEPALFRLGGYFNRVQKVDNRVVACELRAVSLMPIEDTPGWVKE